MHFYDTDNGLQQMVGTKNKYKPEASLNIIVFSKDRACQLELFLHSMRKMFHEWEQYKIYILYTASGKIYDEAYNELIKAYKHIHFIKEHSFKNDLAVLVNADADYTIFFVDDIVWKEPFTVDCKEMALLQESPDILCLSLRLDENLTYCYAYDMDMKKPVFDENMQWNWNNEEGDFGYPMSLDGHIFRTREILPLVSALSYRNPNSLEAVLSRHPIAAPKMICLEKAVIFNLPINKVQTQNHNRHGDISAEYLNKMYLSGYRLSLTQLIGIDNYACHQEVDVTMERSMLNTLKYVFKQLFTA